MEKDKFEVSIDTETHTLYVDVIVYNRPEWRGVSYYNTPIVINELSKQGYKLGWKNCISRSRIVRSDSGSKEKYSKGRWVFKLANKTEQKNEQPVVKEQPVVQPVVKEKPVVKAKPVVKSPTTKKPVAKKSAVKKTTSDVLKEYTKKQK